MTTPDFDFGQLRQWLHEPRLSNWLRICNLLESEVNAERLPEVLPYTLGHLETWPVELRSAPSSWIARMSSGETLPYWTVVRYLDLSWDNFEASWMLGAFSGESLAEVHTLVLTGIGEHHVLRLLQAADLQGLRALDASWNGLGVDLLEILIPSERFTGLERLDLANNLLPRVALDSLLEGLPGLQWLNVRFNPITPAPQSLPDDVVVLMSI